MFALLLAIYRDRYPFRGG